LKRELARAACAEKFFSETSKRHSEAANLRGRRPQGIDDLAKRATHEHSNIARPATDRKQGISFQRFAGRGPVVNWPRSLPAPLVLGS